MSMTLYLLDNVILSLYKIFYINIATEKLPKIITNIKMLGKY